MEQTVDNSLNLQVPIYKNETEILKRSDMTYGHMEFTPMSVNEFIIDVHVFLKDNTDGEYDFFIDKIEEY